MTSNDHDLATEVPLPIVGHVRSICARWPGVVEETAWTGVRWKAGTTGFAHLVMVRNGWPPAYASAAGSTGPLCVLTVRADRGDVLEHAQPNSPYFAPLWGTRWTPSVLGVRVDPTTDWGELAELIELSYRLVAPTRAVEQLDERDAPSQETTP